MDNRSITRRNVLAGLPIFAAALPLAACSAMPAFAADPVADAELVALGKALDASIAAETVAYRRAWEDGGERS